MDSGTTVRVPTLLHFLSFLGLTILSFALSEAVILLLAHGSPVEATLNNARLQLIVNVMTYVIALAVAYFAMPIFWSRPFLVGIEWNWNQVKGWFGLAGLGAGFAAQGLTVFMPHPKDLPVEEIFRNPALIWFLVVFGVVVGPLFEEVTFRGFLLPAIANVVDWARLPRSSDPVVSLEDLQLWRTSSGYSQPALVTASIVASLFFALIHGPQLGFTLPALALLFCVSLALCFVRIRTSSVAASTIMHGCYNLSIFLSLFIGTGGFRHLDKV